MDKLLTRPQIEDLAAKNGYQYAALKAVILVESSGHGFSDLTGKIIIQFEPTWFKRKAVKAYMEYVRIATIIKQAKFVNHDETALFNNWNIVLNNKVGNQTTEWAAFDLAYAIDANAAMESTSIGLMQVMGFHWQALKFPSVQAMWDYAKDNEANQVDIGIRFIKSNSKLDKALKTKDWKTFAYYYNGELYRNYKYDTRLAAQYAAALK